MTISSVETSPRQRRILFDECIGKPHVERLKTFVEGKSGPKVQIAHLLDFQSQGVKDEDWVPRAIREGWIIITQDRGRGGIKKGEPLPRVFRSLKGTHVVLSRRVGERKSEQKIDIIHSVWEEILDLDLKPRGSKFVIEPRPGTASQGKLVDRSPPEIRNPTLGPMKQQNLAYEPDASTTT